MSKIKNEKIQELNDKLGFSWKEMDIEDLENVENVLLSKLSEISAMKKEIERIKKIKEMDEAKENIELLRQNKDFLLKILPRRHDRSSCSDDNLYNAYMEGKYPRCTRCVLLDILNNNSLEAYKIEFDVKIEEILLD